MQPQIGSFFVAHPLMDDPNFARTVVLLAEHNDSGSVGLVLNRPSGVHLGEALRGAWPSWPLNLGGPVGTDSLFFMHRRPDLISESVLLHDGVFFGGSFDSMYHAVQNGLLREEEIQFFAGYSGWSVGQLQAELDEGSWICESPNAAKSWWQQPDLYAERAKRWPEELKLWLNSPEVPHWN